MHFATVPYNETEATYIRKQTKNSKKGHEQRNLEVKLGISYTGKEPRYKGGQRKSKKVKSAGAVEADIDKLIAHRFKGRGMSWIDEGAESLLKIRQTIINGQWED